jgi:hypothetical protein
MSKQVRSETQPVYPPSGRSAIAHFRQVEAALDGIPHLTLDDFLMLMHAEPDSCGVADRNMAEWDLRANGYREDRVTMHGHRRVFLRWVKTTG